MMQWFIQPAVNIFTTVHPFLSAQDLGRHECHVRTRLCCSAQPVNDIHRHVLSCGLCRDGALVICAQQLNGRGTLFHIYQVAVYCSSQHAGQLSLIISWPSGCSLITSLTPSLSSSRSHSCSLRHFISPSLFRMLFFLTYSLSSLFISCLFDHSLSYVRAQRLLKCMIHLCSLFPSFCTLFGIRCADIASIPQLLPSVFLHFWGEQLPFLSPLFEALSGRESQLVGPDFSRSRYLSGFINPGFLEKWRFGQGRA